jgi:cytochrome c-type biogenesis protein
MPTNLIFIFHNIKVWGNMAFLPKSLELWLYQIENIADGIVKTQILHLSIFSIGLVFFAGLITSLSPCTLSMIPLTIGYIGGFESKNTLSSALQSLWFALGFAITLCGLGLAAAIFGKIYGQVGSGLSIILGMIAIAMGLYLLGLIPIQLPNWGNFEISQTLPKSWRSFLIGLSFGLVASPCSTPVLITLLAYISTTNNPILGAGLLLAYALGSVLPLVVAGTFTGVIKQLLKIREWSGWLTWGSGVILIGFGTVSILNRIT